MRIIVENIVVRFNGPRRIFWKLYAVLKRWDMWLRRNELSRLYSCMSTECPDYLPLNQFGYDDNDDEDDRECVNKCVSSSTCLTVIISAVKPLCDVSQTRHVVAERYQTHINDRDAADIVRTSTRMFFREHHDTIIIIGGLSLLLWLLLS